MELLLNSSWRIFGVTLEVWVYLLSQAEIMPGHHGARHECDGSRGVQRRRRAPCGRFQGARRDPRCCARQVLKQHLELEFGSATVEIVEVADPSAPGALDHAVQGVSGIIHVAMDASMSTDPDAVINSVGSCSTSLSEAAARSKDVKSVVLTSSSVAVFGKTGKQPIVVDKQANQDDIVPYAYSAKDDDLSKAAAVCESCPCVTGVFGMSELRVVSCRHGEQSQG